MMPLGVETLSQLLDAEEHLRGLLAREAVDNSTTSPALRVRSVLMPVLRWWRVSIC